MGRKKSKDIALDELPATIRIASKKSYEVLITKAMDDCVGICRSDFNDGISHLNQIVISKELKTAKEIHMTLIHEIIHAISHEYLGKYQLTENQVLKLEKGLYNVLKLNKWIK